MKSAFFALTLIVYLDLNTIVFRKKSNISKDHIIDFNNLYESSLVSIVDVQFSSDKLK
jgi:hypothetical protein